MYKKLIIFCLINTAVCNARSMFSHGYLGGYYCVTDYFKVITNISQHICTHSCMDSEWCFVLAYHHQRLSCSLGRNPCAIAEPHKHYTTMVLRNNVEQECLIWNQWDGSSDFPRIARSKYNFRSVARKVQQTSTYIGIMNAVLPGNGKAYFAINGRETELSDAEMLRVHPKCSLAWVPYTTGQPFSKAGCHNW